MTIAKAGIPVLPGIFKGVITISVISVANSCTFGSTRTPQALATRGMGPGFLAYVVKRGRPVWCVLVQLAFGFLAFLVDVNGDSASTFFDRLLALSGVGQFVIWGSICIAHIRFRKAWSYHGHSTDELLFRASCGVWGSTIGLFFNCIFLMPNFYTSVQPLSTYDFFEGYLAASLIIALYISWKIWTKEWYTFTNLKDIDLEYGTRTNLADLQAAAAGQRKEREFRNMPARIFHTLF